MGMNWKRAKSDKLQKTDLLDESWFRDRDAAARWLKNAEGERSKKPVRPKRKPRKREHIRQGPVDRTSGLVIYTDGACEPNPGKGGWAFVVYQDGTEIHHECGGDLDATNNTMEMTAVLKALEWALDDTERRFARILSDSQYVVKGCNEWRQKWKKRGWNRVGAGGRPEPVKNVELWQRLDGLLTAAPRRIEWVKGHVGIVGNERADELCNVGRRRAINERQHMQAIEEQLRMRA